MIYFKLLLTAIFWGGTFVAGKGLAGQVSPQAAAFLRFAIASAFLLILTIRHEGGLPVIRPVQAIYILLLGLTGVFAYNLFFFTGLTLINANRASLIIATNPIFISLCSALFFKEALTPGKLLGLLLSVAGAYTVITDGHPTAIFSSGIGMGELAIFGCVVSWVSYSLLGKPLMKTMSALTAVCYSSLAGTLMLLVPALSNGLTGTLTNSSLTVWGCLFYLGFFGTVLGFFWYYEGIRKIGPTKAGVFINFVPISAIVLSFLILDEAVTSSLLVGGILVISGVFLTNRAGKPKITPPSSAGSIRANQG